MQQITSVIDQCKYLTLAKLLKAFGRIGFAYLGPRKGLELQLPTNVFFSWQ